MSAILIGVAVGSVAGNTFSVLFRAATASEAIDRSIFQCMSLGMTAITASLAGVL